MLGGGRSEAERTMWPMGVVVVDVDAQDALKLVATDDQEPVEAVAPNGADPAFGERVCPRRSKRGANDLDVFALEDVVEGAAEFAVAVVDQEANRCRAVRE
jgi:hypothetical protein